MITCHLELLERSVNYAMGALQGAAPGELSLPTPCHRWDLHTLLWHTADSLDALREALGSGRLALTPTGRSDPRCDAVAAVRIAGAELLSTAMASPERHRTLMIADRTLLATTLLSAGALEVTAHGWDIARSRRVDEPIPTELADALLGIAPSLVADDDRELLFANAIGLAPGCSAGDRLVAFLGRDPHRSTSLATSRARAIQ
jgi:uncharacterized protein (TIGR03086 family)